ncbi:MAG: 4-alpha-glucanotransferase [Dehalococcoidia bacterium]|nr:4-alpha-glucanotransferase [Dehalococcoidia bacterium]
MADYLGHPSGALLDALLRACYASVADTAIIPMQDVLGLGTESRMNTPSEATGNWAWRFSWDQLPAGRTNWLARITELYGRASGEPEDEEPDPGAATGG